MADQELYIRCAHCGHKEKINKTFFAKVLGGVVSGFGFWAWVSFLFAGTGFALPLCLAIMAGGAAIMIHSQEIVEWANKRYPCPECGCQHWVTVRGMDQDLWNKIHMQEEWARFQQEQAKSQQEQAREQEEKARRQEEQARKQREQAQRQEEAARQQEAAARQRQEEVLRQQAMNQKQQEELRQQKEQLRQQRQQYNETIRQAEQGKSNTPLTVDQLRQEFQNAFLWCHSEFDIYVPFLGTVFGSKIFKKNIRACLERGVIIKIRYGFANFDDYKKNKEYEEKIHAFLSEGHLDRYYQWGQLRFHRDDSHAKLLIVDDDYYILSSMNFLSNNGTDNIYKGKKREKWRELGEKSYNNKLLKQYREDFFSF